MNVKKCPESIELRQLLDGTLSGDRQQACTDHMDSCHGCQVKLEGIATEGTNLSQIVESLHESQVSPVSGYWQAAKSLEEAVRETFVPEAPVRRRDASLEFLQPPSDSAYIGRLAQFDVMRVLGRGGMGLVLEAFDTRLQRNVAIKVLDPDLAGDEVSRQRFCREARAAASISHENVVAVHQVERAGEVGLPYLVMQLISGESLEQRLTREKRLPLREIVRISTQVAHGLAAAYSQGLIHRDIKPGNILLEDSHDSVKLTDFGLARAAEDVKLTRTGFVSGTPLYMAPEQAMGDEADHRSDLFSLGAIMYEMCAGQPPFTGNSALAILRQISDTKHRPLRELNPQTPEWLAETIDQLLAKKPEDRIQTAHHLAELLEFHLALMKTSEDLPTVCKIEQEKESKRNRRIAVAIGAVFSLLGLFGGVFLANRGWVPNGRPGPSVAVTSGVEPLAVLSANAGTVWSVGFDKSDKTIVMGVEDGSVRLWDIASKSVKSTFLAHRGIVWSSKFSHNCELLATAGDDGLIKLWDVSKSEPLHELHSPNAVRGLAFSHDDHLLFAGDRNGGLRVWSMDSDQPIAETQIPRSAIYSVAVSPDDETLATAGSDNVVRLWNAKTLVQKIPLEGHSGSVYGVAFSRDGHRLASVGWDKQVRIWDVSSGSVVRTWDGQSDDIWGVAFSPDGTKIATGGHDGGVRLWNAETGDLIETYSGHKITVHTVAFDHDGKMLASGSRDGSVKIWPVR
ncbi:WD40 repeat domain-containing serine/threonine protein kinase [Schlesneria paludicola]|uniref:WD40 repeat domain-containing serine/threonine protein kinase n=1 Tax=Schlesneria paludicola TaxID=360056 RepID=UPI00029B1446|nr:serine/threonine-protein kinase [Schlesneria paludicola]